jgi:hypothetical protein
MEPPMPVQQGQVRVYVRSVYIHFLRSEIAQMICLGWLFLEKGKKKRKGKKGKKEGKKQTTNEVNNEPRLGTSK